MGRLPFCFWKWRDLPPASSALQGGVGGQLSGRDLVMRKAGSETELQHFATICGELLPMSVTLPNRGDMIVAIVAIAVIFQ
jgi:hypothetical protein